MKIDIDNLPTKQREKDSKSRKKEKVITIPRIDGATYQVENGDGSITVLKPVNESSAAPARAPKQEEKKLQREMNPFFNVNHDPISKLTTSSDEDEYGKLESRHSSLGVFMKISEKLDKNEENILMYEKKQLTRSNFIKEMQNEKFYTDLKKTKKRNEKGNFIYEKVKLSRSTAVRYIDNMVKSKLIIPKEIKMKKKMARGKEKIVEEIIYEVNKRYIYQGDFDKTVFEENELHIFSKLLSNSMANVSPNMPASSIGVFISAIPMFNNRNFLLTKKENINRLFLKETNEKGKNLVENDDKFIEEHIVKKYEEKYGSIEVENDRNAMIAFGFRFGKEQHEEIKRLFMESYKEFDALNEKQLADALNIHPKTLREHVGVWQENHLIFATGNKKGIRYIVNPDVLNRITPNAPKSKFAHLFEDFARSIIANGGLEE